MNVYMLIFIQKKDWITGNRLILYIIIYSSAIVAYFSIICIKMYTKFRSSQVLVGFEMTSVGFEWDFVLIFKKSLRH